MNQNVLPTDPRVIALAHEWNKLGTEGVGKNPEIAKKIKIMQQENPNLTAYRGISQELIDYLRTAFKEGQVPT